ncbi:MAG TPA: PfkB family carbohydrate kinase [Candidatus Nanopelagicales bacterium]|nr:PfkB family carbohydrate kinase [Candidatus Nanopelagicales bacterium]
MSVVVAGEALVDLILRPDGTLAAAAGGGPFNAARTLGRLGIDVSFLGGLADDRFGHLLRDRLLADGVRLGMPGLLPLPTTLALAELDEHGAASYQFYVAQTAAPAVTDADAHGAVDASTRVLHVGTLGLLLEPMATSLERLVADVGANVLVFVDPNCRPRVVQDRDSYVARLHRVLARADVVKVSGDDLDYLAPAQDMVAAARELLDLGPRVVLFTDGGKAVHVIARGGSFVVDVPRVDVVDTVGAGDSFGGGFLATWISDGLGRDDLSDLEALRRATERAVVVAGITCSRAGAEPPHLSELPA